MQVRGSQVVKKLNALVTICVALALAAPVHAKSKDTTPGRLLTGKVLDKQDNPVPDAVVYLTDTRTRSVKTFIVGPDGVYRFPALATNVDYEIYALSKGHSSDTKRMSHLLRIETEQSACAGRGSKNADDRTAMPATLEDSCCTDAHADPRTHLKPDDDRGQQISA